MLLRLLLATALLTTPSLASDIPTDVPVSDLLKSANAHMIAGKSSDALSYYDAAITRDPQNYLSIFKRGAAYLSLGKSSQAERDFNRVLELKPGFEGALLQRARIRARDGNWDAASDDLVAAGKKETQEFLDLEESQGAAQLAIEADKANNWEECIQQAGVAIRTAAAYLPLRELRVRCRLESGDAVSATTDLQHIISMTGSTERYLQLAALTFFAVGETDKGLQHIRKCLQSDPDNKKCRVLMKKEKALEKRMKQLNTYWEKGSFASATRVLMKSSEDEGLIADSKTEFEELKQEGMIHEKAPNGLYNNLIEKACQAYIEVSCLKNWYISMTNNPSLRKMPKQNHTVTKF
jgi:DnaJ family protein C protein 3